MIDQLRANPELVSEVIEESLRINTIPNTIRRIAVDTEFDGLSLKQNEVAWLMLSVANRDDEQIEQPDVFDPMREEKPHLAFRGGIHRCVGSHLARMEMRVLLAEWIKRMPDFKQDETKQIIFRGGFTFAMLEFWLKLC